MADAVTGFIGGVILVAFVSMIAAKINDLPLWIVCIVGVVLMAWAFWEDDFRPLFGKSSA